jgi:UDP-N-acetylglucosamine acyltransferase
MIHPTALIDPTARIQPGVKIGAYSVIGADVEIGEGTEIGTHCVINGPCRIGTGNKIYSHAALGGDPQDKKFHGEHGELIIGNNNTIREFTTFNRGTADGGGVTRIGNDNWIMAYVHIAHDCQVANNATLAGHAEVGDWVILGGFAAIHQFCKIGAHAFIGMGSLINADVPPFVMTSSTYAEARTINAEGLKRRGFSSDRIRQIKAAYRSVYMSGKSLDDAKNDLRQMADSSEDVQLMLAFIDASTRGILR